MDTPEVIIGGAALLWWLLRKKPAADVPKAAVQQPGADAGASLAPAESIKAIEQSPNGQLTPEQISECERAKVMKCYMPKAKPGQAQAMMCQNPPAYCGHMMPAENFLPVENPAMEPNPIASGGLFNNNEMTSSSTTVRRIGVRNMTPIPIMVGMPVVPDTGATGMS